LQEENDNLKTNFDILVMIYVNSSCNCKSNSQEKDANVNCFKN